MEDIENKTWHDGALLFSGRQFDIRNMREEDISLVDIVQGLCLTNRYAGQSLIPYSVGEHTMNLVEYFMPDQSSQKSLDRESMERIKFVLLHDAAEVILGDKIRPVKRECPEFMALDREVSAFIWDKYGVEPFDDFYEADYRITENEIELLFPRRPDHPLCDPLMRDGKKFNVVTGKDWKDVRRTMSLLVYALFGSSNFFFETLELNTVMESGDEE